MDDYCGDITPSKISDCTNHEVTDEEKETFPGADSCCYESVTTEGNSEFMCQIFIKSLVNEYIQGLEASKEANVIDDYTFECESVPDPDSGSGTGSNSNWLSLSLSFLLFGLLL